MYAATAFHIWGMACHNIDSLVVVIFCTRLKDSYWLEESHWLLVVGLLSGWM